MVAEYRVVVQRKAHVPVFIGRWLARQRAECFRGVCGAHRIFLGGKTGLSNGLTWVMKLPARTL